MTHAMAIRSWRRASRCSILWTNIRPARRLSKSFSIWFRRCDHAIIRSPPRRSSTPAHAASRPALSAHGKFRGVCSNYLAAQPADATVYAFVRKPTIPFHPPENPHLPMIMIGPGTGVAPFRGFLSERAALKKQSAPIGESLLFFGCRDPMQDFLHEDEMRAFEAGRVTETCGAFSRE